MRSWLARNGVYRSLQLIRGESVFRSLRELEASQWLSSQSVGELQWERFRMQLVHAATHVPYYRRTLQDAQIRPADIQSPADLRRLPMLDKATIRTEGAQMRAETGGRAWRETTSGSTGTPFTFLVDAPMLSSFRAAKYRGHGWFGLRIGDREGRFYGLPMDPNGRRRERRKDWLLNRRRHSVFDMTDGALAVTVEGLRAFRPSYLYGYASAVHRFASFVHRHRPGALEGLRAVISTSEVLLPEHRTEIARAFDCPVANEYGASETGILAFECPEGAMHVAAENVLLEIVDDSGRSVEPTSVGHVVVTELHNRAMPLIRYRLGDLARWRLTPCTCGRGLPSLDVIEGRTNDMVRTSDGRIANGLIFYYISRNVLEAGAGIAEFRVRQKALDLIEFEIVRTEAFKASGLDVLRQKTREYLGSEMRIEFRFVDSIPPHPSGKLMHFISEI